MLDPREGVAADGTIRTGADRARLPEAYTPVISTLVAAFESLRLSAPETPTSLVLYGSLATGQARPPTSDVDAFTIGLPGSLVAAVGRDLTGRFGRLCREVAIGAVQWADFQAADGQDHAGRGVDDEIYGNRVFLKHYCVVLAGDDRAQGWAPFSADARAARGFNGDIAAHLQRWRTQVQPEGGLDPSSAAALGRSVARKTLLAVAGLVSVREHTWTTDRATGARRWAHWDSAAAPAARELLAWSEGARAAAPEQVEEVLRAGGVVERVAEAFGEEIGLWRPAAGWPPARHGA